MKELVENIESIVEQVLPDDRYFIVDIKIRGHRGNEKLVVIIDGDEGVDITVCSEVSSNLSRELDALGLFEGSYTLEVTSPGLDLPLINQRQYVKNIGRSVKVTLSDNTNIKGKLEEVRDNGISIKKEKSKKQNSGQTSFILFDQIKKTNVLVTFK